MEKKSLQGQNMNKEKYPTISFKILKCFNLQKGQYMIIVVA